MPSLALHYQEAAEKKLSTASSGPNDLLKYERFKLEYESLKLEIKHNTEDPEGLDNRVREAERNFSIVPNNVPNIDSTHHSSINANNNNSSYEPWHRASISRIIANYYID